MDGPSTHLSWKELACKDGTPYPQAWRNNRAIQLSGAFEYIREQWNKPIVVVSAFRTPEWNKKIGGVKNSQHTQGRALDLRPPEGVNIEEFYSRIKEIAPLSSIRGIGKYLTFVHIDVRPTTKIAYWRGYGAKDSISNA